jgi:queuine/archaeosine tRNA-ribosyltransferase
MLEVKEMNANILLAIHNVAQFDFFFEQIRANIGCFDDFVAGYIETNCYPK